MKIGRLTIEINISWEGNYMRRVKSSLRKGKKLEAIKIYKDATGLGLRESKAAVDELCPIYLKKLPEIDALVQFQSEQFNK